MRRASIALRASGFMTPFDQLLRAPEFEIRVLMVERDHGIAALAVAINRGAVHGDDVQLAVVIAIDQPDAAAHGFDNVFLVGRRKVRNGEPRFLSDVFKLRNWS